MGLCLSQETCLWFLQFLSPLLRLRRATLLQSELSLAFKQPQGCVAQILDVIFQNHTSLWVCITVRQPSPLLQRGRMEPSWRLNKYTHKPLHISFLIHDLMGAVTLEIFDLYAMSPQGHWFTGDQCLKSLLLKPNHQRKKKNLRVTMGTDMFNQSDFGRQVQAPSSGQACHMEWRGCLVGFTMLSRCLTHGWLLVTKGIPLNPW